MMKHQDKVTVAVCDWDGRIDKITNDLLSSPFNRVVLCIEDRHAKWRKQNVIEAVDTLKTAGFEVIADPWAVGGLFAGESYGNKETTALEEWLGVIAKTNADAILWDEPHFIEWLDVHLDLASSITPHIKNVLALQPERDITPWVKRDDVSEISISTYLFPPRITRITQEEVNTQIQQWLPLMEKNGSAWVQNWGLPEGTEWLPSYLISQWKKFNIPVNIWAWEAFETVSEVRPKNYKKVWKSTLAALS